MLPAPSVQVMPGLDANGDPATLNVARTTVNDGSPLVNVTGTPSSYTVDVGGTVVSTGQFTSAQGSTSVATELQLLFDMITQYNATRTGSTIRAVSTFFGTDPDVTITIDQGTS